MARLKNCYGVRKGDKRGEGEGWRVVWYDEDRCWDAVDFGDCTESGPEPYPVFPTRAAAIAARVARVARWPDPSPA